MSVTEKRVAAFAGLCIIAGMLLYVALELYPGPFRYRNLPRAAWSGNEIRIEEKAYTFYGALEDGMHRDELVAYEIDEDGYVTEFYSVSGYDSGWIIAKRRVVCGDTYVMREVD